MLTRGQLRRPREQRVRGDADAGRDRAAQVVALGRDRVEDERRAEIDDDQRRWVAVECRDDVEDAICAELARVVAADRDSGLRVRADDERLATEGLAADRLEGGLKGGDGGGERRAGDPLRLDAAAIQLAGEIARVLSGGAVGIRGHAQARGEGRPVVDADRDARVADVDGEKQGSAPEAGAGGAEMGGRGSRFGGSDVVGSGCCESADYTQFIPRPPRDRKPARESGPVRT